MLTTRSEDSVLLFLSLQALQLVLERRSGSISQACRLAISWELYILKWSVDLLDIFFGHCRASWCQSWGNGWALAFFLEPTITVEYVVPLKIQPPKIDIEYILGCPLFASTMYLMPDDLGTSPK